MAVNDSLLTTLDRIVEEDFGPTIVDAVKDIDDFSKNLVDNTMGVTRDGLGRGWYKIQVFKTGLAGAASWRGVAGGTPTTSNTANQFVVYGTGAPQTFPTLAQTTVPAYVQASTQLKELYGTFHVPVEITRLDQLAKNIGGQMEAIIEGAARRAALREILAFWGEAQTTNGTTAGAYVTGTAGSSNIVVAADGTYTITGAATGGFGNNTNGDGLSRYQVLRLHAGECVDVYEWVGGVWAKQNGSNPCFVTAVDDIGVKFALTMYTGGFTIAAGNPFEIHPFGSTTGDGTTTITSNAPTPLASWIVSSGTLFNAATGTGLSLTTHPYFKSLVKAMTAGETTLSEQVLNRYLNGLLTAKSSAQRPDTMVTTPGVKSKYVNNIDYSGRRDRYSVPVKMSEGYTSDWDYQRDGYEMQIKTSNYCPSGTLYALKLRNGNIQKIVPPSPPGTGKDSRFGGYVDFFAKITGNSIFTPTRPSGDFSDFMEAPFKRWVQFMPQVIPGMKLTGLDEDIATS